MNKEEELEERLVATYFEALKKDPNYKYIDNSTIKVRWDDKTKKVVIEYAYDKEQMKKGFEEAKERIKKEIKEEKENEDKDGIRLK